MYRFLASKRWLVRVVAGLLLVAACVRLGMWQLDRNDERSGRNDLVAAARDAEPDPINSILSPGTDLADDDVWHPVEVSGHYDADNQFVVQLRPLDGERGVHVLTPLITSDGDAVLVDRGFFPSTDVNLPAEALPPPPSGEVDAVVRLRASETGRSSGNAISTRQIRNIDTGAIAPALSYPVYQAWGELVSQTPEPDAALVPIPPPDTDSGPHLSYAVQWFIFACIGVGGFIALVRAEAKGRRRLTEDDNQPQPAH